MKVLNAAAIVVALCSSLAAAQDLTPATPSGSGWTYYYPLTEPRGPMLWGSISDEALLMPGLSVGLSALVGQVNGVNLELRGTVGAHVILLPFETFDPNGGGGLPIPISGNLDLLLSTGRRASNWYFGPSMGTLSGAVWMFGGVLGGRSTFGSSNWGYYGEAKLRAAVLSGDSNVFFAPPSLNFGLTYRY